MRSLLGFIVCATTLLAGCNRDPLIRKQRYFNRAIELLKHGNLARAQLELRNSLQLDPNFVEAANILAELEARQSNYRDAYSLLQRAEQTKPDYLPVRKGLAKLDAMAGKTKEAEQELEFVLDHSPDDTDALYELGALQMRQKKSGDAEGTFNRILEIQPANVRALLGLASMREQNQDPPGAERYLRLALARNPRSSAVYLSLIRFLIVNHRPEVDSLFAQALKISDNSLAILGAQEAYYEGAGRFSEAEAVVRKIESLHSTDPRYWGAAAAYYIRTGNWAQAQAELERALGQHKDDPTLLHKLIELHLQRNDGKTAEALNQALLKKDPHDAYGHLFKGRLALSAGRVEEALSEFDQARHAQGDFAAVYYWMAQANQQRRSWRLALQNLQTAVELDPNYETARLNLARLQLQSGAVDVAMANAKALFVRRPDNLPALLLYTKGLLATHQYPESERMLKDAAARGLDSSELHRQMGILSLVRKDIPGARREFQKAWDLDSESKPVLEALLLTYMTGGQTAAAGNFLQSQLQAHAQNPLLYYELGQLDLILGRQNDAIAALEKAHGLNSSNPDSALLLAQAYIAANQREQAIRLATEVIQQHQQDPDVLLRAGTILDKLQRWEDARRAYERAVQLDDDNAIAKNNLAWSMVAHGGDTDVALKLAQRAKEQMGDNVQVTDTIGWIYYQKHVYQTALRYLKECVDRDRQNAEFQFQLGMTYAKLGQPGEARQALLTCLMLDPQSANAPIARKALAAL